jgi:hypothetical protein
LPDGSDCLRLLQEQVVARAPGRRFPPATDEQIQAAELSLEFPLPAFLCRAYTTIANGGFGPGRGLLGVQGGAADEHGNSIVDLYDSFSAANPEDRTWQWPEGLVPICPWGGSVYSCVDCATAEGAVICLDLTGYEPGRDLKEFLIPQRQLTVEAWLRAWAEGVDLWTEMFPLELA